MTFNGGFQRSMEAFNLSDFIMIAEPMHLCLRTITKEDSLEGLQEKMELHEDLARKLVEMIARWYPSAFITVICYYKASAEALEDLECKVNTIDGYRGQQADVAIVVTAPPAAEKRYGLHETRRQAARQTLSPEDFIFFNPRAVVALTRAKEALFIIGDVNDRHM